MIADRTLSEFCAELSARTPSPGGGATAAVVGAIGTSQLVMVAEFSDWAERGEEDPRIELRTVAADLLRLADEDAEAYAAYRAAPKSDRAAQERIAAVPRDIQRTAARALALADSVSLRAPKWFAVDVSIAVAALRACVEGANSLVSVNS